jgi:hypothetical protein
LDMINSWKSSESIFENLDNIKKMIEEDWGFSWWDGLSFSWLWWNQRLFLILLIDSVAYRKMSYIIVNKSKYQSNTSSEFNFPWRIIIWIIIGIIVIIAKSS